MENIVVIAYKRNRERFYLYGPFDNADTAANWAIEQGFSDFEIGGLIDPANPNPAATISVNL